jgi:hypothetical protein
MMSQRGTTLTPQPDHRPVRVFDHVLQAEAFLELFHRSGAADLEVAFQAWVDSKDFSLRDKVAIAREVHRILGNDDLGRDSPNPRHAAGRPEIRSEIADALG